MDSSLRILLLIFWLFHSGRIWSQKVPGQDPKNQSSSKHIHLPILDGIVQYEYISHMDSSLSKERIYHAALNWYYKTFPYAKSRILVSDLKEGLIRARGEFKFSYSVLWERYSMRVNFILNCSIRYGKYRLQLKDIEVEDQIEPDSDTKSYAEYEPRNLLTMYHQYLNMEDPPDYAREKMENIDTYFRNLIQSFSVHLKSWTRSDTDF